MAYESLGRRMKVSGKSSPVDQGEPLSSQTCLLERYRQRLAPPCQSLPFLSQFQRVRSRTVSCGDPHRNAVATFVLRASAPLGTASGHSPLAFASSKAGAGVRRRGIVDTGLSRASSSLLCLRFRAASDEPDPACLLGSNPRPSRVKKCSPTRPLISLVSRVRLIAAFALCPRFTGPQAPSRSQRSRSWNAPIREI
jgi:hypothetical protein